MFNADADLKRFGEGEARKEAAVALHDEADHVAMGGIEQPRFDQDRVHRRVEQLVIDDVVEMAIGVIVLPARRLRDEALEGRARQRRLARGRGDGAAQARPPKRGWASRSAPTIASAASSVFSTVAR